MKKVLIAGLLVAGGIPLHAMTVNFDDMKKGEKLIGWDHGFFGPKGEPVWTVESDATAPSKPNVLKQTGKATYGWLVKKDTSIQNGTVEGDLKISSGKEDPEVGLVWRHKDGKNYYYVRINAVEDNVIFYRMNQGKKELVKEADAKVGYNNWHHVKVQFKGEQVDITFDQKPVISVRDGVIKDAGRVGLFTTADSVGEFDNISIDSAR